MNSSAHPTTNFMHTLVSGMAQMVDVQLSVTRSVFETQAKMAALFGAPDFSRPYATNGQAHFVEQTIGQALDYQQRVVDALSELQTQWIGFVRQHAEEFGERLREDIQETGTDIEKGITEATELAKRALPSDAEPHRIERIGSSKDRSGEQKQPLQEKSKDPSRQASNA